MKAFSILGAAMSLAAWASTASAHAILLDSSPRANEIIARPARLVLRFNGRIEKGLSTVILVGGPQKVKLPLLDRSRGRPDTGASDSQPDRLKLALPSLAPGSYRVEWTVLSVDGHFSTGVVNFVVAAPAGAPPR